MALFEVEVPPEGGALPEGEVDLAIAVDEAALEEDHLAGEVADLGQAAELAEAGQGEDLEDEDRLVLMLQEFRRIESLSGGNLSHYLASRLDELPMEDADALIEDLFA